VKAYEALIAWTPRNDRRPTAGQVKVGPLRREGESDWASPFAMTGGAAWVATRELRGAQSVARLFIDFHTLIVRDRIDPALAHEAFLAIDEYAESISPDIHGARDPGTDPDS